MCENFRIRTKKTCGLNIVETLLFPATKMKRFSARFIIETSLNKDYVLALYFLFLISIRVSLLDSQFKIILN